MNQIDPKSLIIHSGLPPVAKKGDRVSIDTEFFGMEKSKLHRPHGRFAGMGCSFDGVNVYIITDEETVQDFMSQLDEAVHIYHTSLFDIRHIRRYCEYPDRTRIWDTMVLEQIRFAGWFSAGEFSLADVARRYLGVYMPKEVREEFAADETGFMTREQMEYLAVDIVATWRVYQEQKKIMDENDLNVWKNIDRPAIYSLLKTRGMKLDVEAWNELYKLNLSESERIQGKYGHIESVQNGKKTKDEFVGINLSSWQQVLKRLKADGFNELYSTNEKSLNTITGESEFARDVLEYRGRVKAAGTYGMKWVDEWLEADGRIYSNFYVNGTATGRFCVSADTLLETTWGTFRICDLPLTDSGFGAAILTHRNRYQNILRKINKGKEEMFLVTLDNGSQIKCTLNHRFLTSNGWKKLKDITNDDTICVPGKAY